MNTSPEPFSNILISLAEDLAAILLTVLALAHPLAAAATAAVLLAAGTVTAIAAFKLVRRGWRKLRERRRGGTRAGGPGPGAGALGDATV